MRRSLFASRIVALTLASGTVVLAGCPAASDQAGTVPAPPTAEVEADDVAEEEAPAAKPDEPLSTSSDPPTAGPRTSGVETVPAVTIERPNDFLRPTLPDAALQNAAPEPADPPEQITDRSAEAKDANVLPGGTPIDDLFEGLEDKPKEETND